MSLLSRLAASALCAAALSGPAAAATFTPDMWEYEISRTLTWVGARNIYATTTVPLGSTVPDYCDSWENGDVLELECYNPPDIDLFAIYSQFPGVTDPLTTRVGFNASGVVCVGDLIEEGCTSPTTGRSAVDPIRGASFNALLGTLDIIPGYTTHSWGAHFRPDGVSGARESDTFVLFLPSGTVGQWETVTSYFTYTRYTFSGHLVSAPTPVPVPAALPLLAAGLGALALIRRRGRISARGPARAA